MDENKIEQLFILLKDYLIHGDNCFKLDLFNFLQANFNAETQFKIKEILHDIDNASISASWLDERVTEVNNILLKYALCHFNEKIEVLNHDIFESLMLSIKYLGDTLNDEVVSKSYLFDTYNLIDNYIIVVDLENKIEFINTYTKDKLGLMSNHFMKKDLSVLLKVSPIKGQSKIIVDNGVSETVEIKKNRLQRGDGLPNGYVFIAKES